MTDIFTCLHALSHSHQLSFSTYVVNNDKLAIYLAENDFIPTIVISFLDENKECICSLTSYMQQHEEKCFFLLTQNTVHGRSSWFK